MKKYLGQSQAVRVRLEGRDLPYIVEHPDVGLDLVGPGSHLGHDHVEVEGGLHELVHRVAVWTQGAGIN